MQQLITVPTFNFSQGDIFDGAELPITVCYYRGSVDSPMIELTQEDRSIQFTDIKTLKKLVKNIEALNEEARIKITKS